MYHEICLYLTKWIIHRNRLMVIDLCFILFLSIKFIKTYFDGIVWNKIKLWTEANILKHNYYVLMGH